MARGDADVVRGGHPVLGNYWRRRSFETKAALVAIAAFVVGLGGFLAATGLAGLDAEAGAPEADAVAATETVERLVTVTNGGVRTVVRTVQVRVRRPPTAGVRATAVELVTVTTPGRTERRVVPVVREEVVTLPGRVRTVVETRDGRTRTTVVTNERVVTTVRAVTTQRTVTDVRTERETVPVTTVRTVTERVPVTNTVTLTQAVTNTVTDTVTLPEVTLPPVTVTVTCPPRGC